MDFNSCQREMRLAFFSPNIFSLGGWVMGIILVLFAFIGRKITLLKEMPK